ncbi:MAG: glycosyltransferase family 2 protein [Geobacteraceae bacterium]
MSSAGIDIIIPVWNNPAETRECLAALVEHSADFRLILMDTGSDSATEQLLHDFAEFLDNRALLLRSERARGVVATVNRGLARAEAPLVVVMHSGTRVMPGWLESIREASLKTDAGIIVPPLKPICSGSSPAKKCGHPAGETDHGSFFALGLTRNLYTAIGGFDESLDGDVWCLKDYSRRADRAGFTTLRVAGPPILYRELITYGSRERREKMLLKSIATYTARWGETQFFCAFFTSRTDQETLGKAFAAMVTAARRGHHFFVFASPPVYRQILSASLHLLHDAILVNKLSRFFPLQACRNAFARLKAGYHDVSVLSGIEGLLDLEGEKGVSFAEVERVFCRGGLNE